MLEPGPRGRPNKALLGCVIVAVLLVCGVLGAVAVLALLGESNPAGKPALVSEAGARGGTSPVTKTEEPPAEDVALGEALSTGRGMGLREGVPAPAAPGARVVEHPSRPISLNVPEGWTGRLTVTGLYLESGREAVEIGWLDSDEMSGLPALERGAGFESWTVQSVDRRRKRLSSGADAQVIEAVVSDGRGEKRAIVRVDLPLAGGTLMIGAEGRLGEAARLEERALQFAAEVSLP